MTLKFMTMFILILRSIVYKLCLYVTYVYYVNIHPYVTYVRYVSLLLLCNCPNSYVTYVCSVSIHPYVT